MRRERSCHRWGMVSLAEPSSWIKIDRNILEWRWFTNPVTLQVFLYILLKANVKPGDFGTVHVLRGQLVTSYGRIAEDLNISASQARTSLNHLKSTGEIRIHSLVKCSIITVVNYSKYQSITAGRKQAAKQPPKKESNPEQKQKTDGAYAPKYWELDIPKQAWGKFKTEEEWDRWKENHIEEVTAWLTN